MNAGGQPEYREGLPLPADPDAAAIDAHYYTITDVDSWPVAGLLVLLDGQAEPARAELHLYEDLPSHIHEGAVRQSRQVLQAQYAADTIVPLRVLMNTQMRDAIDVRLDINGAPVRAKRRASKPLFAAIGAALALSLILLAVFALRGSPLASPEELLPAGGFFENGASPAGQVRALAAGQSAERAGSEGDMAALDLPPSVNAREDLRIGTRVAIVPGLRLTLRSEPGAELGVPLGYMMDNDTAVIVGGPRMTEGTTDTIVWWLVNLDDGTEAWAAANTSDKTLLIPAP